MNRYNTRHDSMRETTDEIRQQEHYIAIVADYLDIKPERLMSALFASYMDLTPGVMSTVVSAQHDVEDRHPEEFKKQIAERWG